MYSFCTTQILGLLKYIEYILLNHPKQDEPAAFHKLFWSNKRQKYFSNGEFLGISQSKKRFGKFYCNHAPLTSISLRNLRQIWIFLPLQIPFVLLYAYFLDHRNKKVLSWNFRIFSLFFLYFFWNIFLIGSCIFWFLNMLSFLVQEHELSAFAWSLKPTILSLIIIFLISSPHPERTSVLL